MPCRLLMAQLLRWRLYIEGPASTRTFRPRMTAGGASRGRWATGIQGKVGDATSTGVQRGIFFSLSERVYDHFFYLLAECYLIGGTGHVHNKIMTLIPIAYRWLMTLITAV